MFTRLPFTNFVALGHNIQLVGSSEIWMEKKKKVIKCILTHLMLYSFDVIISILFYAFSDSGPFKQHWLFSPRAFACMFLFKEFG